MAVSLRVDLRGDRKLARALRKLQLPEAAPIYRRAQRRSAIRLQSRVRGAYLSGQMLQRITGELSDSIVIDESELPETIRVGSALVQSDVLHEGGRGMPRRPYLERALEDVISDFPDFWVQEMERAIR